MPAVWWFVCGNALTTGDSSAKIQTTDPSPQDVSGPSWLKVVVSREGFLMKDFLGRENSSPKLEGGAQKWK